MVETLDLLPEDKVLQEGRTAVTDLQAVLIGNRTSHIGREECVFVIQIVLRQELLGVCGSTVVGSITTVMLVALGGHVGTDRVGNANEAEKGGDTHGHWRR